MNAGAVFQSPVADFLQSRCNGVIANRRRANITAAGFTVLADHVGHPQIAPDRNQLSRAQSEVVVRALQVPRAELAFGLRKSFRQRQHEPFAPPAQVVANVRDDLRPFCEGAVASPLR